MSKDVLKEIIKKKIEKVDLLKKENESWEKEDNFIKFFK